MRTGAFAAAFVLGMQTWAAAQDTTERAKPLPRFLAAARIAREYAPKGRYSHVGRHPAGR